jgi:IclR family pca regulon transcriptional regulator
LCDDWLHCAIIAQNIMQIAKSDFIEGMAKGMAVLESFDTERQRLNATLAAQRSGITRAAARRHLLTLAHLGYLETDGSYFWLSPKVLRFSGTYLASARLPRILQPTLNRLSRMCSQACSAVVLDEREVVIVARSLDARGPSPVDADQAQRQLLAYGLHLGARLPAHATSTGRMLLATRPKREVQTWLKAQELPRLTAKTLTQPQAVQQAINEARIQDWCLASEEHELGVMALAVPLRNMQGQTMAALNVVAAVQRYTPETMQKDFLPLLLDAARELRPLL